MKTLKISRNTLNKIFIITICIVYIVCVLSGLKTYNIWNQITDVVGDQGTVDFVSLYAGKNVHLLRISLVFPIIFIARLIEVDQNYLFSLVLMVIMLFVVYRLNILFKRYSLYNQFSLFMPTFFIALSFFMNGRIVFALLGMTIIISVLFRYLRNSISGLTFFILTLLALYLCSVSSGTIMVAIFSLVLFMGLSTLINLPKIKKKIVAVLVGGMILAAMLAGTIQAFIDKNIRYYSGSVFNMLDHGAGIYLKEYYILVLMIILLLIISIPYVLGKLIPLLRRDPLLMVCLPIVVSSICIGMFGFLSLLVGLPAYLLVFVHVLSKIRIDINKIFNHDKKIL